jgi:hypothetical protein
VSAITLPQGRPWGIEHQLGRGATALYFQDYDQHLFELDTAGMESELPAE